MSKKIFFILIVLLLITPAIFSRVKTSDIPKNIKIIAISATAYSVCYSVINLENNEIVIIEYATRTGGHGKILEIYYTGMIVNPDDYIKISISDAPFKKD